MDMQMFAQSLTSNEIDELYSILTEMKRELAFNPKWDEAIADIAFERLREERRKTYPILPDTAIKELRKDNLILAIKEFRSYYGCGLKEAKDAVDAYVAKWGRGENMKWNGRIFK